MSEENLVRQCAPTLAGIKTGTIFPVSFETKAELTTDIRDLNRIWFPRDCGCCLMMLPGKTARRCCISTAPRSFVRTFGTPAGRGAFE